MSAIVYNRMRRDECMQATKASCSFSCQDNEVFLFFFVPVIASGYVQYPNATPLLLESPTKIFAQRSEK